MEREESNPESPEIKVWYDSSPRSKDLVEDLRERGYRVIQIHTGCTEMAGDISGMPYSERNLYDLLI